jgi:outer membrane protein assembly factor BamB
VMWRQAVGAAPSAGPALAGERILIGLTDGTILALDAASGTLRWTRRLPGRILALTVLEDRVLVGTSDNYFWSLNLTKGKPDWSWRTGGDVTGTAAADAKRVYFVSLDNMLRALGRTHGDLKWQRPLPARPTGGPVLTGKVLIVGGVAPDLRSYKTANGVQDGSVDVPGRVQYRPFLLAEHGTVPARIIVLTGGGQLLAIGQTTEPPLVPMTIIPGRLLAPEVLPPIRQ